MEFSGRFKWFIQLFAEIDGCAMLEQNWSKVSPLEQEFIIIYIHTSKYRNNVLKTPQNVIWGTGLWCSFHGPGS